MGSETTSSAWSAGESAGSAHASWQVYVVAKTVVQSIVLMVSRAMRSGDVTCQR